MKKSDKFAIDFSWHHVYYLVVVTSIHKCCIIVKLHGGTKCDVLIKFAWR